MDGSKVADSPVRLEGIGDPAILARVQVVRDVMPGTRADSCLRGRGGAHGARPRGPIVERIGAESESVSFRESTGLRACDNSTGAHEESRRWCGGAFGRLYDGHLRDPRLSIGCTTAGGKRIGFAWVEPANGVRYVVVEQQGFVEVYEVAGKLPVRIASTRDVSIERSRATFEVSEHDRRGRLRREYRLDAAVAG